MSIYEISSRYDFASSNENAFSAFIKKFESENKVKNYEVVDGNLVTPITTRFSLRVNIISPVNALSTLGGNGLKNLIEISEPTLEDFLNSVRNNLELVRSYYEWVNSCGFELNINGDEDLKKYKERYFSNAMRVTSIKPFITENVESDAGICINVNDEVIIESVLIDVNLILDIVDNHPELDKIKEDIRIREEEMKKLILAEQTKNSDTVNRNNYEMWKLLNEKYQNGDFNKFI